MNTKASQTLRYLEAHEVFTLQEYLCAVDPHVRPRTRYNNLRNAQRREQAARVAATSPERTLVDCLRRLPPAGGLEELLRSLGGFGAMKAEDVAAYVRVLGSPSLAARAGWPMSMMSAQWRFDAGPLSALRSMLGRGTHWLGRRRPGEQYEFVAAWRLNVPAGLPYEEWLAG